MILKFCYNKNGLQGGTTMDSVLNFFRSVYAFIKKSTFCDCNHLSLYSDFSLDLGLDHHAYDQT